EVEALRAGAQQDVSRLQTDATAFTAAMESLRNTLERVPGLAGVDNVTELDASAKTLATAAECLSGAMTTVENSIAGLAVTVPEAILERTARIAETQDAHVLRFDQVDAGVRGVGVRVETVGGVVTSAATRMEEAIETLSQITERSRADAGAISAAAEKAAASAAVLERMTEAMERRIQALGRLDEGVARVESMLERLVAWHAQVRRAPLMRLLLACPPRFTEWLRGFRSKRDGRWRRRAATPPYVRRAPHPPHAPPDRYAPSAADEPGVHPADGSYGGRIPATDGSVDAQVTPPRTAAERE
ncbi:MAG: hypothetical protein ACREIV_08480, partial [Planctomycetaceae bacterium]